MDQECPLTGETGPLIKTNSPLVRFLSASSAASSSIKRMQGRQLRAVVVDDEPIARRILIEEIAEYPWLVVVGEADNGTRAVEVIQTNSPDLVFLDIQMPGCDGFEVLRRLGRIPPP